MAKEKKGVRLEHISKIYQDPKTKKNFYAVHDTSLDIEPGSFVTLLGPSGCGKTTTLRMIAGFESPDEGEIYLGGEPINALTPNKRDTAMVFQSYALLPHYNIFDNVAYGLKLRKLDKAEIRQKVTDILKLVVLYTVTFVIELVKANIDMAKRVYGGCKVNPGIVKVPTDMTSDQGLALVANSITLTPGTITMDVAEEEGKNYYYIHWVDVTAESGEAAGEVIKGNLERSAKKVFK